MPEETYKAESYNQEKKLEEKEQWFSEITENEFYRIYKNQKIQNLKAGDDFYRYLEKFKKQFIEKDFDYAFLELAKLTTF